jgi:hypothetical protein
MYSIDFLARRLGGAILLAGIFLTIVANAAPPAAPAVTAGADMKQLQFDWDIVPRSNYYEFWYKSDNGAPWVKFSELRPWETQFVNHVSAHLFNWDQALYRVNACNFSGCAASSNIAVRDQMFESIGYFKPDRTFDNGTFGLGAVISENGETIASFMEEPTPGAPPNSTNISTAYVFTKVDGSWRQQARLVPPLPVTTLTGLGNWGIEELDEVQLALSASGNILAVGTPFRTRTTPPKVHAGISIYRRDGASWVYEYGFVAKESMDYHLTGFLMKISEAGSRIFYRRQNGQPGQIMERTSSGWRTRSAIEQPPDGSACYDMTMSADGQTIVYACQIGAPSQSRLYIAHAPSWEITESLTVDVPANYRVNTVEADLTGDTIATTITSAEPPREYPFLDNQVIVFKKTGGTWRRLAPLRPGEWNVFATTPTFGDKLQLSRGGEWLAASNSRDQGNALGVVSPPLTPPGSPSYPQTRAVYIFDLRGAVPRLRRLVEPNVSGSFTEHFFGSLDFANDGKTLLIGDPYESNSATGIDGDRSADFLFRAGAIWLY